jgi:formamidopyrimidine-DNA glycosylase
VLDASVTVFANALRAGNHTLKRALTDPHVFSGIGNAYSDEILHAARLSPFKQTGSLNDEEIERLFAATRVTLTQWIERLRAETGADFPEKVTAFRPQMAVHGRYGQPCPDCGSPVQRIVYAANEANYCATCQTGGRLLADRSLSRLLREDWPRTLDELERRRGGT